MTLGPLIPFGDYLPDLPYFQNPGLVEARNVIPVDATYKDYLAVLPQDDALPLRPQGAICSTTNSGTTEIYVGTASRLYQKVASSYTDRTPAPYSTASDGYWRFAQFDNLVIGTNYANNIQVKTTGVAANFADLSATAPKARQIGVINDFVVVGDTNDATNGVVPYRLQWPAINDPTNWQTPGTSGARAVQAGEQFLDSSFGSITAIAGGQFYGLIFQQRAITRMTYVGGDIVFQFEVIERGRGCWAPQSMVQIGSKVFFLSHDAWYVTDGQTVAPIGDGRVDKTFLSSFDQSYKERVTGCPDFVGKVIYWCVPTAAASAGVPDSVWIYNFTKDRWSHAIDTIQMLFPGLSQGYTLDQLDTLFTSLDAMTISLDSSVWAGGIPTPLGFQSNKLATFGGTAQDSTFETGEIEISPPGLVYVSGVKPLVTGAPTTIRISIATRDTQDNSSRMFGSTVTRNSRSGICDFRTHARYASARIEILGGFDRALGIQIDADSGDGI